MVYLQDEALTSAGLKFTTSTPGTEFLGKPVSFEFERSNGRGGMQLHTGLITAVIEDSASPSIHNERLVVSDLLLFVFRYPVPPMFF